MLSDVRNYYGLARDFGQAGYFETEHSEQIVSELKLEIKAGKLVALSGIVGYGKTTTRALEEAYKGRPEIGRRGYDRKCARHGFTESGSIAPLKIDNQNAESERTALGMKASYEWKVCRVIIKPEISSRK